MLAADAGLTVLFVLAFTNGANDVGKSVASLVESSGGKHVRRALAWGGLFSALGSASAVLIAKQLLSTFNQAFLTPTPTVDFVAAALLGTTVWVLVATVFRFPVSLTHALTGSLIFEAVYLFGLSHLSWTTVGIRVLLPLAGGPFAALILTYVLHRLRPPKPQPPGKAPVQKSGKEASLAHWGAAGASAYARGINDAPKMAALGAILLPTPLSILPLRLGPQSTSWAPFAYVAVAVFIGSIIWGHWVMKTIIGKIVPMAEESRVTAHAATAALVSIGAVFGAPLSTTHMSRGAEAGMNGGKWEHVRPVLVGFLEAWLITLPIAGLLTIGASWAEPWIRTWIHAIIP
jgi:inorganic phosphate transporter, PiT family